MKLLFAILPVLLFAIGCSNSAEKVSVPEPVKAKFATMYPKADNAKWEMEDGNYEATFKAEKTETSVIISADGNIVQTETEIDAALLPQPIHDYVAAQLGGKKITSAAKIMNSTGNVTYEAEVGETDYLFDSMGQFTGKEEEEKGKEDDKD